MIEIAIVNAVGYRASNSPKKICLSTPPLTIIGSLSTGEKSTAMTVPVRQHRCQMESKRKVDNSRTLVSR